MDSEDIGVIGPINLPTAVKAADDDRAKTSIAYVEVAAPVMIHDRCDEIIVEQLVVASTNFGNIGRSCIRIVEFKLQVGVDATIGGVKIHNPEHFRSRVVSDHIPFPVRIHDGVVSGHRISLVAPIPSSVIGLRNVVEPDTQPGLGSGSCPMGCIVKSVQITGTRTT